MNVITFVTLMLLLSGTMLLTFVNLLYLRAVDNNVNSLNDQLFPAESCFNCPALCATAADCPNVLFSNLYTANVTCVSRTCLYDVAPLTPQLIPIGRLTDLLCQNIVLPFRVNCLSMKSIGDCNGIFTGCVGTYPCQLT